MKPFKKSFVQLIECYAAMRISCIHSYINNISVLVTGGLNCESKAFLMLALVKNSAFGVGGRLGHFLFFWRITTVKRLFTVVLTVLFYFFKKLFAVYLGGLGNQLLYYFLDVCISFYVCSINKYCFGRQISRIIDFVQNTVKYLLYYLRSKSMEEIVAERGEMRCFSPVANIPENNDMLRSDLFLLLFSVVMVFRTDAVLALP